MKKEVYSISEMADIHEISRQTLLYYDRIGLFKPAGVDPENGYRYYTLDQCPLLREIRLLTRLEVPLAEIRRYLEEKDLPRMKALLSEQKEKTRRHLRDLRETERILSLRLENLEKVERAAAPQEGWEIRTLPRRLCLTSPYPGAEPTIPDSLLLFRQMIGRYKHVMDNELFREYYHELKFKHGQLLLDSAACASGVPFRDARAAVYADEAVVQKLQRQLKRRGHRLPPRPLEELPAGDYAVTLYTGTLAGAGGAARDFLVQLKEKGLSPGAAVLFTAVLEPPFVLDPERQTWEVQAGVKL